MSKINVSEFAEKFQVLYEFPCNCHEIIQDLYAQDASFHDPLVDVTGRENIHAQFKIMSHLVSETKTQLVRGTLTLNPESISLQTTITIGMYPFPRFMKCKLVVFSVCDLNSEGKIIVQNDHWDLKSVLQNIPFFSMFYNAIRPVIGSVTCQIMKGCSKISSKQE